MRPRLTDTTGKDMKSYLPGGFNGYEGIQWNLQLDSTGASSPRIGDESSLPVRVTTSRTIKLKMKKIIQASSSVDLREPHLWN